MTCSKVGDIGVKDGVLLLKCLDLRQAGDGGSGRCCRGRCRVLSVGLGGG